MIIHEYSKYEVATYLRDFNRTILCSIANEDKCFFDIFRNCLYYDKRLQYGNTDYYFTMLNIYELLLQSKNLTMFYDNYFDFLYESKIDSLKIPDEIFVNKEDRKNFSNKQIIKFIRNALNHNDNPNHDLCKFIRTFDNDKELVKIEILLKNTKPVPFHVIVDSFQLFNISEEICKANSIVAGSIRSRKQIYLASYNCNETMNNLFYRKFFVRNKLTDQQKEKLLNQFDKVNATKNYESFLIENGLDYKDYDFTLAQKYKVQEDLEYWESIGVKGNDITNHLIKNVLPLSIVKDKLFLINFILTNFYMRDLNKSLYDLLTDARRAVVDKKVSDKSPLSMYVARYGLDEQLVYEVLDYDNIASLSFSIYYGYLFDSLVTDEKINITDEQVYDRERIRNSFVHMRWFKGAKEGFKLYDWDNGIDNEFNREAPGFWKGSVSFINMDRCAERYFHSKISELDDKDSYISVPIHVRGTFEDGTIAIHFLKNGKNYHLSLIKENNEYNLKVIDEEQFFRPATNEEKITFLEELDNLYDYEKEKYSFYINDIKNNLLNDSLEFDEDNQTRRI